MLDTYILLRMLYGLETLSISPKNKEMLGILQKILKRIQSIPQRTANEASYMYILFGILPAEALLDIKTLIFFHNIITDHDSILYQVAMHQLATKSL